LYPLPKLHQVGIQKAGRARRVWISLGLEWEHSVRKTNPGSIK